MERVDELIRQLETGDPEVATDAAFALRHFNDPQAIHALIQVAGNKNISIDVREAAVKSLGDIGNPNAVDTLIQILEDSSDEETVRIDAAIALGQLGDTKAIDPLVRTLKDEWKWRVSRLREAIAESLGAFRDQRVIDALIEALGSDYNTALAAAESLLKLRDRRAVEPLISILDGGTKNAHKSELAAQILGVLGDPRAIPALVNALRDTSKKNLRRNALESLQRFIFTHPDAVLQISPDDRHLLGREIQDAQRDELLQEVCK
jgi:HEAT repeat protein